MLYLSFIVGVDKEKRIQAIDKAGCQSCYSEFIMRKHLTAYIDNAISLLLLIVAGLTPLLFFNQTTEFFEMPKLAFLIVMTLLLYGLWIFSCILKGKVAITRTPLDIPFLVLLGVILLSTYFSASRYASIYGDFPKVQGSAVSWVTYILLYFVTISNLKTVTQVRTLLYVLYASGFVTALITLASFFGLYLPFDFAKAANFTPTGSSFSTIAFILLLLPLPLLSLINPNKYFPKPFALVVASLFAITVVLIGNATVNIVVLLTFAFILFISKPQHVKKTIGLFLIPTVLTLGVIGLAYFPASLPSGVNGLQKIEASFPREIQLPFAISWKISASAFRDAPFIGTGPSTYLFNFTSYKPLEFNATPFWNFSFDTAYDEFLYVLGTLGILGILAFFLLSAVVINNSRKNLGSEAIHHGGEQAAQIDSSDNTSVILPALAVSGILSIVLLAIHAATLVSVVVTVFVLAALMMSQRAIRTRVTALSMGIKASTSDNKQFDLFPVLLFIIFLVGAVPALFRLYTVVVADYYHRQALSQANKSGTLTYQYLQKAESMNPYVDLYRVDMAQTNFALANAIAVQKGPTKSNPKGSLTDNDKKTIQTLLSQSINEGRASVAINPQSARNWEVLASIYRNISGVAQNALVFSLDSYGRAIQRDPLNPVLRVNVGGIYYSIKSYDNAIRFFSDAANLKPDYANAYFNLAIAFREKGDLQNAKAVAEQTVKLLSKNTNSADYKVASALLKDLDTKASTESAQTAPAASPSSALQNSELPNVDVSNLNNPPSVTPVPTVQPNEKANLPQNIKTIPTKSPAKK